MRRRPVGARLRHLTTVHPGRLRTVTPVTPVSGAARLNSHMRPARALAPLVAACAAASLASCGGSDASSRAARALPQVHVRVTSPSDLLTTRGTTVTLRGTVDPPGSDVRVLGHAAEVIGSAFTTQVDLQPGANVIDIAATAPRRGPALTAIRVTREMPVTVPDLSGLAPEEAQQRVESLGLVYEEHDGGGLLEELLPGKPGVCEQDPSAGDDAMRGTKVRVIVAKRC